ncbi:nitrile hydratase subunit beta [Mycobacterium sp. OAE908]|uniref:nitrile hydratase subunit beta n=1 Tax=Mycobacterium sp. OAE908 TaxID=2817899 RepID=UPI001AE56597
MTDDYVSHADIGGRQVKGAIVPEPEGQLWHADWEPRVLAMTLALGATGAWNLDMSRAARETLPDYDQRSYYERWAGALFELLADRKMVSAEEIEAGHSLGPAKPVANKLLAEEVDNVLARGAPTERPAATTPAFAVGQRVRTRAHAVPHHTRLPGYARGKVGRIERINGVHVFADTNASGEGEQPQWLYTVVFRASDLWSDGDPRLTVSIDAWEPYLEHE